MYQKLLAKSRSIGAAVRAMRGELEELSKMAAQQREQQPDAPFKAALQRSREALERKDLSGKIEDLEVLEDESPDLQTCGDLMGDIRNGVEQLLADWPREDSDLATARQRIEQSSKTLDEVAFACCRLTVREDVKERLEEMKVGAAFSFEAEYKDRLPHRPERQRVLTDLAQRRIWGWVDLKAESIYRISPSFWVRLLTYLAPVFSVLLAVTILIGIANLKHLDVDLSVQHLTDAEELVSAFLLVLAGALIHLVVENVKQLQIRTAPIVAIGNTLNWMHLRWAGLSMMALPLLVTVIGMKMLGAGSGSDQIATYVFAGYSADSISGLFLTRFDSSANASLKGLTKRLAPKAGGAEA
jgi:hypothetical protein